jgi:hypothetical protein
MHRTSGPVRRSIVGVAIAAALLAACSAVDDEAAEPEVRGVTIDRSDLEDGPDEGSSGDGQAGDEPVDEGSGAGEASTEEADSEGASPSGIGDLLLLRSGPLAVGTVWLAAAGDWVGLDAQTIDPGTGAVPAHLDVVLDPDGGRAQVRGCTLRLVAPDDATFEAVGDVSAEIVLEDATGGTVREPVDPMDIEVVLAPGQAVELQTAIEGDATMDVGPGEAVRIHCEGRFDRE